MKKWNKTIGDVFFSILLAGELSVILDTISVFFGKALSVPKFAGMFAVLAVLMLLIPAAGRKVRKIAALGILLVTGIPLLVGTICWNTVSQNVKYNAVDDGKARLYSGQTIMLLVPHQDDDINVLGGVMEEYVKYGSEVYVVFSTNGDYYGLAETRFQEALNALGNVGIPEDHVIFLGYGDQWDEEGPHLYNAADGEIRHSYIGYTETYGAGNHSAYREGREYTIGNFHADMESVILEYKPDVLFCVDYDYNIDHRALSLSFEKVMGKILRENETYRPVVLKGYAYNTAWEAEKDFYGENLLPAQNIFSEPYHQMPAVYRWEDRVRLPVNAESLSRSVISAEQNVTLSMYKSQGANMYGPRVINSDKVFWLRNTASLCYQAEIQTSSGSGGVLNDFMLLESVDLLELGDTPYDGAWVPTSDDAEKQIRVVFAEPVDLDRIVLYDHVDPEKNVRNALIEFEDGTSVETGPLDPGGAANTFQVEKQGISSFSVTLTELQGEAGLTEIEAYGTQQARELPFIKIMDEDGSFAYDYWIDESGVQIFRLYACGMTKGEEYSLSCSDPACSAQWEKDGIRVTCPSGETCTVTVTSADGTVSDSVYIQNPGRLERAWKMFWLRVEETVMNLCETRRLHERLFVCRLAEKAMGIIR